MVIVLCRCIAHLRLVFLYKELLHLTHQVTDMGLIIPLYIYLLYIITCSPLPLPIYIVLYLFTLIVSLMWWCMRMDRWCMC